MKDFVTRPQANDKKINSKDEFELCYMRHQYFRKVEFNPTEKEMSPYRKIIEHMSKNTFYTYRYLFNLVGMGLDDITAIGKIHLVNYLGLFSIDESRNKRKFDEFVVKFQGKHLGNLPTDYDILSKNKSDYTLFMRQRFTDLVRICQQKAKNIKGARVDEYSPFSGKNPPPSELRDLLEDHDKWGYRKIDNVAYKAARRRAKAKKVPVFILDAIWYVAVPLEHRNLTVLDFAGAGIDPYESLHNQNPEQLLQKRESEKSFDKKRKKYKNYSKEDKAKVIKLFIEKNAESPHFQKEIVIAKKMLRKMGVEHV